VLAAVVGAVLMALPLLHDPAAYFRDDMETYFVPTLVAVGRTIWATGEVPLLTLHTWLGGNLAGEFQYGLFNPILLLLYACLPVFATQDAAAAFLVIALGAVLASGAFALGRALRLDVPLAHTLAAAIAGNGFLCLWFAASWFPGFSSSAFMVWAMAFLILAPRRPGAFVAAASAVFLMATSGWPHAVIALGVFTAVWIVIQLRDAKWREAVDIGGAALLGLGAAAVAIGPFLGVIAMADRAAVVGNNGLLVANLRDVLSLSNPLHFGVFQLFGSRAQLVIAPLFYVAWFILPLAAFIDWAKIRWAEPRIATWAILAGLMLIATQGPSQALWMRYPIKFLPYFHIAILVLALLILQHAGLAAVTRRRRGVLLLILAAMVLSALQSFPALLLLQLGLAGLFGQAALILQRDGAGHPRQVGMALACTTLLVAVGIRLLTPSPLFPEVQVVGAFRVPREIAIQAPLTSVPNAYELHLSAPDAPRDAATPFAEAMTSQIGLAQGRALVNGYSPIGHRGLVDLLCVGDTARWPCPNAFARLLRTDPGSGSTFADLMRLDTLVLLRDADFARVSADVPGSWTTQRETPFAVAYRRTLPNADLPGSLSWVPDGIRAETVGAATARREVVRLTLETSAPGPLVFARPFWEGYAATLNGRPVPVRPLAGIFVSIDLPTDARSGELVLTFSPKGLLAGSIVSLVSVVLVLLYAGWMVLSSRRPAGQRQA